MRRPVELPAGVYGEVRVSANDLRDRIRNLLEAFGIDGSALRIDLRQDRDADLTQD